MSTHQTHQPGLPDLPRWLWIGVPALIYPVLIASIFVWPWLWGFMTRKEGGIEWLSVIALLIGVGFGLHMLAKYRQHFPSKGLVIWFALATAGMFVLAGEEISWGQHLKLWTGEDLPETWQQINDQQETNLHNLTNALDQGPTNLVVGGVFVAFVILPLYLRRRKETMAFDNPGYWFWPTRVGLIAGLGVLLIPFPKRIYELTLPPDEVASQYWRHSEIHEFYIALLMMLYVLSVWRRLKNASALPDKQGDSESSQSSEMSKSSATEPVSK